MIWNFLHNQGSNEVEQIVITEQHNEALEHFEMYFSDYSCFKVALVVDEEIQDYHGEDYQKVCIKITDTDNDNTWTVMLDERNNYFYNVYEDIIEELDTPSDLFKFMYFDLHSQLMRLKR